MSQITWHLKNVYKNVPREKIEKLLEEAFKAWELYLDLRFKKIDEHFTPDISIGFFSKDHNCLKDFDGKLGVLAHTTNPGNGITKGLFIHFDNDEDWIFDDSINGDNFFTNDTFFFNVAVHEIGHILGLNHSDHEKSIMNKHYSKLISKPSVYDVISAQNLHGKRDGAPVPEVNNENSFTMFLKLYYVEIIIFLTLLFLLSI